MPKVTVTLTGADKENVQAVVLGDKRWGVNGKPYDTEQTVTAGEKEWLVDYPNVDSEGNVEVPDQDSAVLTVEAEDDETTVTIE